MLRVLSASLERLSRAPVSSASIEDAHCVLHVFQMWVMLVRAPLFHVQAHMSPSKENSTWMKILDSVVQLTEHSVHTATLQRVVPPFQGHHKLPEETYQAAVDASTPEDRWCGASFSFLKSKIKVLLSSSKT